jgi:hypothetical protein
MAGPEFLFLGSVLAGGAGIAGSIAQANAQKANLRFQSDLAQRNARQAELNAMARERRSRREARREMGRTRAAFGASGVQLGGGTPLDVLADQAMELEQNILLEQFQGESQATQFRTQSAGLSARAGSVSPIGGIARGAGTILTGGFGALDAGDGELFGMQFPGFDE